MNVRVAALLALLWAAPAVAENPGMALFTGQVQDFARHPCHSCHGRDGRGGVEGRVPDLTALVARYDAPGLARALAQGLVPDGRRLSRSMPRYPQVTADQARDLLAYLTALPALDHIGVHPDRIVIGVIPDGPDDPYPRALQQALDRFFLNGRLYGRVIELRRYDGADPAAGSALALIGPPAGSRIDRAMQMGLPVLFPRMTPEGTEDPTILRGLSASHADIAAALAADLRAQTDHTRGIEILGQVPAALRQALGYEFPDQGTGPAALLAGPGATLPEIAGQGRPAYLLARTLRHDPQIGEALRDKGWQAVLVLDAPQLVRQMMQDATGPDQAHATLAAQVLLRALRNAGRDLGRGRLMRSLAGADLSDLGLDYRHHRLTGTSDVRLLPLDF